jgi:hypothetical protein
MKDGIVKYHDCTQVHLYLLVDVKLHEELVKYCR